MKECNFCEKKKEEVRCVILAKDGTGICDECVRLCLSIMVDNKHFKLDFQFVYPEREKEESSKLC